MDNHLQAKILELETFHDSCLEDPRAVKARFKKKMLKLSQDELYLRQTAMRAGYRQGWEECKELAIQNAMDNYTVPKKVRVINFAEGVTAHNFNEGRPEALPLSSNGISSFPHFKSEKVKSINIDSDILKFINDEKKKIEDRISLGFMPEHRASILKVRLDLLTEILDFSKGIKS